MIWDEWEPVAATEHGKKLQIWEKKEQARLNRIAKKKSRAGDSEPIPKPDGPRMAENDADTFLSLAAAMKILLARSIDLSELPRARMLLQDHLDGFHKACVFPSEFLLQPDYILLQMHQDLIKPNHHYVTHIFEQIHDYGPVYGFWTFLFERLNKLLKGYAVNNHGGGELEVTFYREFSREIRLRSMVRLEIVYWTTYY